MLNAVHVKLYAPVALLHDVQYTKNGSKVPQFLILKYTDQLFFSALVHEGKSCFNWNIEAQLAVVAADV